MQDEQTILFSEGPFDRLATPLKFDGKTVEPVDVKRLTGQWLRVWDVMRLGDWLTLSEIQAYTKLKTGHHDSEGGVGARLRDFRKERFGSHRVDRRRRGEAERGLHEYKLTINGD